VVNDLLDLEKPHAKARGTCWESQSGPWAWRWPCGRPPERPVKRLLASGLLKILSVPPDERQAWEEALREIMDHDLTRADVVSHFAVAADLIRRGIVRPGVYTSWPGRIVVLSAANDPTQGKGDRARYETLFGRPVEAISLGAAGHTGLLLDPDRFVELVEQALE